MHQRNFLMLSSTSSSQSSHQLTELVYSDGYIRRVWLCNGNVDYLEGKHIPLFIVALLLLISIPYTADFTLQTTLLDHIDG